MPRLKPQNRKMLIGERRKLVVDAVNKHGRVIVGELAALLNISEITIRKDLAYLQTKGLIQRTHGGAIPLQQGALADPTLTEKEKLHHREKERIAAAAARMVKEGDCIILDSGTTTTAIARALRGCKGLTVITNALNIAAELADTDFEVILTGGTLRRNSVSLVGPYAEETLREMHADIFFLGVDGFDLHAGVSTPNVLESRVGRAMAAAARQVVAVCDSSKLGRRSLALVVPIDKVHTVITDKDAQASDVATLRDAGLAVQLV